MKKLSLLLFVFGVISCSSGEKNLNEHDSVSFRVDSEKNLPAAPVDQEKALRDSIWANNEHMDFAEVKLNGRLNLVTDTSALFALIGKPDEIETPDYDDICVSYFGGDNFKYVNYHKTRYELNGKMIAPNKFNFETNPNIFLKYHQLILSSKTTITELQKTFPNAVKLKYEMDVQGEGKLIAISLKTKNKNKPESSWILFFKGSFLLRIDYWMPC